MSTDNNKTHDALVRRLARKCQYATINQNYHFLPSLKMRSPKKVDRIALELHQEAFSIVDCNEMCQLLPDAASHCHRRRHRQDRPTSGNNRAGVHRRLPGARRGRGRLPHQDSPCPFLGNDNLCKIYDVRPEKCQGYPFMDRPDFVFMTMTHANNAVVCPAVFYLVEQMKRRMGR